MTGKAPLSPREPMVDQNGRATRSWWRYLTDNIQNIGTTQSALVVKSSALLLGGTISSGGTIEAADIPASTLLGNAGVVAGVPEALALDVTLGINSGAVGLAKQAAQTVLGVGGTATAQPGPLLLAGNLSIINGDTLTDTGLSNATNADSDAALYAMDDTRGRAADLAQKVAELEKYVFSIRSTGITTSITNNTTTTTGGLMPLANGDIPIGIMCDSTGQAIGVLV